MYYTLLLWICSIGFFASVPLVLALRARRPRHLPWWLVGGLAAALGWIASNAYAALETQQITAWRNADSREGMIAEYWQVTDPSVTLPWGWIVGLVYLLVCLGLYRLFRESRNRAVSRPLIALLTMAVALAIFSRIPPWIPIEVDVPFDFVFLYTTFLICAGPSLQLLRLFRSPASWHLLVDRDPHTGAPSSAERTPARAIASPERDSAHSRVASRLLLYTPSTEFPLRPTKHPRQPSAKSTARRHDPTEGA